jgi:hypothetical protein
MKMDTMRAELDGCAATATHARTHTAQPTLETRRAPRRARAHAPRGARSYAAELDIVTVDLTGGRVPPEQQLRVFVNFGEHGRELITCQVAAHLLRWLAGGAAAAARASVDASTGGGGGGGGGAPSLAALTSALSRTVFKLVPMENRGGRVKVEAGELCLRKNGRGVDTNRNWPLHWGFKEKDFDPYEEAPGAHPFSEPEASLLRDALAAWRPHAWVNVHSGMRALFMPYDHVAAMPQDAGGDGMRAILASLAASHCTDCVTGSGGASVGYLAHGTATDYIYANMSVPVVMTWEIYGDESAANDDCFRMFNPTTRAEHDAVVANWAAACLAVPGALHLHPDIPAGVPSLAQGEEGGGGATGVAGGLRGGARAPAALRRAAALGSGGRAGGGGAVGARPWVAYGGAAALALAAVATAAGSAQRVRARARAGGVQRKLSV